MIALDCAAADELLHVEATSFDAFSSDFRIDLNIDYPEEPFSVLDAKGPHAASAFGGRPCAASCLRLRAQAHHAEPPRPVPTPAA